MKGFKVYELDPASSPVQAYGRRDIYKICLVSGQSILHYPERSFSLSGTCLLFGNPYLLCSTELISEAQGGYGCLFTEDFLRELKQFEAIQQSPLFKIGGSPILALRPEQSAYLTTLFQKMLEEQDSAYVYRDELLRNYVHLILLEGLKLQRLSHRRTFRWYCRPPAGASALLPPRRALKPPHR
jgi:AraC family transcriptional activator of pobA